MHSKLKRGIKKIELMELLGTDPDKICKERKKFSCETCGNHIRNKNCPNDKNFNTLKHNLTFVFYRKECYLAIYQCWKPK